TDILALLPKPTTTYTVATVEERPALSPVPPGGRPEVVGEGTVPGARGTHSRRWAMAAAILVALVAGLGFTEATGVTDVRGTIIRFFSPDGTLVVQVDDPDVSVTMDSGEMIITGAGAKEIRLKPGEYKVLTNKDGKVVRQELVTVAKNGR